MRINSFVLLVFTLVVTSAVAADDQLDTTAAEETANNVCAACHGAGGNSVISVYPKLAGQHSGYLYKQLSDFKDGSRANAVMAATVANLSLEELQAVAKFYGSQTPKLAKAKTNGHGSLGEKIYRGGIAATKVPACSACHGANGEGIPKRFPRLSGQHADYTLQQLKTFRTNGRANAAMMQAISAKMTEDEMAAVADYIQGLR